jgi:hypothetical protein
MLSYKRSLEPPKGNIQKFETLNFVAFSILFSIFVGHFDLLVPDPDPEHWNIGTSFKGMTVNQCSASKQAKSWGDCPQ